ncbi:hypothetical protein [Clostridium beijerinckii]|nr:hypothetical protein [Clostridium beijerinckii]NRT78431.1 hypothetical protein [Clostridium beijerinckii]
MGVKNRFLEIRLQLGYKKQKDFADYIAFLKLVITSGKITVISQVLKWH